MTKNATIMNVRLPQEIIDWIDGMVVKGLYGNRSEAIRDFLRDYVVEKRGRTGSIGVQDGIQNNTS